jgi:hypothetical protein
VKRLDEWEPVGVIGPIEGRLSPWGLADAHEGDEGAWARDTWLWCVHCGRFQQAETVRVARNGLLLCSFADCSGSLMDLWRMDDEQHAGAFPPIGERVVGQVHW